jgi:hypothetical protein
VPNQARPVEFCPDKIGEFVNEGRQYPDEGCALTFRYGPNMYDDYEVLDSSASGNPCSASDCDGFNVFGYALFNGIQSC